MTINSGLTTEIQKLAPSAVIELFVIDATSLGGDVLYFHAGTNKLNENVVWQGQEYIRFPVQATGFEYNGNGQFPRPQIQVSNAMSAITQVLLAYNDLLGAKVTRRRTLAKFLDAVNFTGGVNDNADPTAAFEEDVYFIDQKSSEDKDIVQFTLAAAIDLVGVQLPRRTIIQNICTWIYRGPECGYTGPPVADANDQMIAITPSTAGQALLAASAAVQLATGNLAMAQAALTIAAQNQSVACSIAQFQTALNYTLTGSVISGNDYVLWDSRSGNITAKFGGSTVSLGSTYRQGKFVTQYTIPDGATFGNYTLQIFEIQKWQSDGSACSDATTAYNAALTNRDNAVTDLATANSNLATALSDLPPDDPMYSQDVCGKRLASCKLRFGSNQLPFGSFPSAGLTS